MPLPISQPRRPRVVALAALLIGAAASHGAALAQDPLGALQARSIAATCTGCHGTNGAARGDMKVLAGVSADKIIALVNDFKSGAQPSSIMQQIAKGYTDAQIAQAANYFAAQKAPK